jgi:ubiquinone/menaquinone biosynthesis C-methylase UbiE
MLADIAGLRKKEDNPILITCTKGISDWLRGSGEVVGIEREPRSIARATARLTEAGLCNVSFTQSDAAQIPRDKSFDAAVGRYILCFLPDPVAVLRSLSQLVRPGGVLAFQ